MRTRHFRAHVDACAGALEVIVVELQRAGLHLLGQMPVVEVVALAMLAIRWKVRHRFVARHYLMGAIGIGQHQHVTVLFVAEVVVDTFLFHQPADKVEAGLTVLHAVFPLTVGAAETVFEVGKTQVAKHLLDDLRDGLVLEDAAIGGLAQQPQPRPQGHPVTGELAAVDALAAARHDAVKIPRAAQVQLQAQAHGLAQQLVEVDGRVVRGQLQLVVEQPPQLFAAAHFRQDQRIRAQRAVDLRQSGELLE
ncbi:hypothetical protein D3C79_634980 [compost metagenome]